MLDRKDIKKLMQHWNIIGSRQANEGPPTIPPPDIVKNTTNGISFDVWLSKSPSENSKQAINTALLRIINYNSISCPQCNDLFPGWLLKDNNVVPDDEFVDPDRYYAVHFDHDLVRDEMTGLLKAKVPDGEEYISPSHLAQKCDAETTMRHLRCTNVLCNG